MKNLSLSGKIRLILTGLLCLVIVVALGHMTVVMVGAFSPKAAEEEDLSQYEMVFTGNITIFDEPYEVLLKGKDGSFTMDANTLKGIMSGSYTFTEGQGWTFTFRDNNSTIVRSQYDKDSKSHSFIYALDMGSRGTGNIRLTNPDQGFNPAAAPWDDIPFFSGTAGWFGGTLSATAVASCDEAGNFRIFCTGDEINEITGTYVLTDGNYVFTTEDGTVYTSRPDPDSGLPVLEVNVHRPALEAYGAADTVAVMNLVVLVAD